MTPAWVANSIRESSFWHFPDSLLTPGYPDGIGGGRPNLSGGLRVGLVGLPGYQDLPGYPDTKICPDTMVCQLGTSQVPAGTSWYQLGPAGTQLVYQLVPAGTSWYPAGTS